MHELHAITKNSIPKKLQCTDSGYSLRPIALSELLAIEDRFFKQGEERKLRKGVNTLVFPNVSVNPSNIEEYATLAEFSLALLTVSGHPSIFAVASFSDGKCVHAKLLERQYSDAEDPHFVSTMTGTAVSTWLHKCLSAQKNLKDRMHITASRYIKYARSTNLADALMDLCISLESLLDSQTEISFRFGTCLAKVTGEKGSKAEEMARLLSDLYDVRSKIAHGDPIAAKLLKAIEPKLSKLRALARRILTIYILFSSEHSRDKWKAYIRSSLFT